MTKGLDLRRRLLALVLTVALVVTSVFAIVPTNAFAEGEDVDDGVADVITLTFTDSGTATIQNKWTTPIIVNGGDKDNVELASGGNIEVAVSNGTAVTITESANDVFRNWHWSEEPLVKNVNCALTEMPEISKFTSDIAGNTVGHRFFFCFNYSGSLTSLPEDSFDTSSITTVGGSFFDSFNFGGSLTSLPEGSFDTSSIATASGSFFDSFNSGGALISLPEGSFDTSSIATAGASFFGSFNAGGSLTSLPEGSFDTSSITTVGEYFFSDFNAGGSLTSLPAGSFDTSGITTAGVYFFGGFNSSGALTSLPAGSFDTSSITTVGGSFFSNFNADGGSLTSLPEGSFDTSSITTAMYGFFDRFNGGWKDGGSLTSLPEDSFDTSSITTAGPHFFYEFNDGGALTSLPAGSFDTSSITTVGAHFFDGFNAVGSLTSLPAGSFDISGITTAGFYFFGGFNSSGALTSLPEGSFDTSSITTMGPGFFRYFNSGGALTSLPTGSFDTSSITTASVDFFGWFNNDGSLTSLPEGSFDTSNITTADGVFFSSFNSGGSLTSLPEGSFDTSSIATAGGEFFDNFNSYGSLTSLPSCSFDTSGITAVGDDFFRSFNYHSNLTSLPVGSFDTSGITTVGNDFFSYFNWYSKLTSLPAGSFDTSGITIAGDDFFSNFNYYGALVQGNKGVVITNNSNQVISNFSSGTDLPASIPIAGGIAYINTDPSYSSHTVTFDANGGSPVSSKAVNSGVSIGTLPTTTRTGYAFDGWYTESVGGTKISEETTVTANTTYYAHWIANQFLVKFDSLGGSAIENWTVNFGDALGVLPVSTRSGYTLDGWYTSAIGGTKISENTKITAKATFYAHWSEKENSISDVIIAKIPNQTYTGKAKKPTLTVKDGSKTLVSGTDYTASYSNNINAGTAKVTITGNGNYTGTASATFKIVPANVSVFIVAVIKDQVNDGKAKKPTLTVKHGSVTLKLNTHYTVKHSIRTDVGNATITITGKGNYTGTKTVSFKIVPKATSISKVTPAKKQLKITWGKVSGTTKYEVRYRVKGTSKWTTKTVAGTSKAYKAKILKKGKTYQVQVRSYKTVSGVKYYSAWSKTKTSGKVK
ncbi:MAG: InlB B-repeat-containing protein [Clostridiales Family XIII bacterium]|jgi:uncharacterized repeat protein (TIGR02543 family)|nr:InlB B-repeat-containing protein [Clostridiales Family XIII bacterium]